MVPALLKSPPPRTVVQEEPLFNKGLIVWRRLTPAEQMVCANLILVPVWWLLGVFTFIPTFIALGVLVYEWRERGEIQLKAPRLLVWTFLAFTAYGLFGDFLLFVDAHPLIPRPDEPIRLSELVKGACSLLAVAFLYWYIQSRRIRVRLEVVAWACSVLILQILAVWVLVQFVFFDPNYNPARTLLSIATGKSPTYFRGVGNINYLVLYWPTDKAIAGFSRYYAFFHGPESFALFAGVVGLIALDLKHRVWSLSLFTAAALCVGLSGTRMVWIVFPLMVLLRFLLTTRRAWIAYALIGLVSFTMFSVPPVTSLVTQTYQSTVTAISDFRGGSTDSRSSVYQKTLQRIPDKPLFGHGTKGEQAVVGEAIAIGSHSFILGNLLYQNGLVGAGLFLSYWAALGVWLYQTRWGRPLSCFLIVLMLSLCLGTMVFERTIPGSILLSLVLYQSTTHASQRTSHAQTHRFARVL